MAMSARLPTEPLRDEHRLLLPRIEGLDRLACEFPSLSPQEQRARLFAVVGFLRDELLPYASAEESVLYPTLERVSGCKSMMLTMSADHREITRRVHGLHTAARAPNTALDAVPLALAGLASIVLLHLRKVEELLLPILDEKLSHEEVDELFGRMSTQARETADEEAGAPLH